MVSCDFFAVDFAMQRAAVGCSLLCKSVIPLKIGQQKVGTVPLDGSETVGNSFHEANGAIVCNCLEII